MDPNIVHRQFLPGYADPSTWSSILYSYGGQGGPAPSQLHDLRAEQQRAINDNQRQQISGHEIAEFFARTAPSQVPGNILGDCHLQPPAAQPQQEATAPHDVVLDLGLNTCISTKKAEKTEMSFIQDAIERSKFDKRRLKTLKTNLKAWYKRTGCVTVALTYQDGQVYVSGPDHMMSLNGNQDFKNIFMNTITSYDQLSRLADIVSNCNEGDNGTETTIDTGPIPPDNMVNPNVLGTMEQHVQTFNAAKQRQSKNLSQVDPATFDQVCKYCPERFSSKHFLKKHMFEVHNKSAERLTCPFCNKQFMTRWKLDRHTISHTGAKPYNCIYCPKRFAEKNKLICHVKCHKESFVDQQAVERRINSLLPKKKTSHDCIVCGKSFLSSWKLRRHIRVHSGEKPFKCNQCSKSFIEKSKLDLHMLLPHDSSGKVKDAATPEKKHQCDQCSKKFVSLWKLKRHALFHSGERPYQCEQCDKGFVENNKLMMHIKFYHTEKNSPDGLPRKIIRVKKYECNDCNKKFATQWKLRRHSQTHSENRPFRCDLCKRGFLTKNKLDLHNFTYHSQDAVSDPEQMVANVKPSESDIDQVSGETQIKDEATDKAVDHSESLLLPGMSAIDSKEDTESNETEQINSSPVVALGNSISLSVTDPTAIAAQVGFTLIANAESRAKESQANLHTCEVCNKDFITPSRLKRHMMTHTGEKPHKCTLCAKRFTERRNLVSHLASHGVVEASDGNIVSVLKDDPINSQTSGKHACEYCEKRFISPWKLKRHMSVHTGQKPFYCTICNKTFTEKNKLENHLKATHPNDIHILEIEQQQQVADLTVTGPSFTIVSSATVITSQASDTSSADQSANIRDAIGSPESAAASVENRCLICSEVFASAYQLSTHVQLLHNEKPIEQTTDALPRGISDKSSKTLKYGCNVCGKGFITPSKLKRHGFSHGAPKPFKCKKCGKTFSENNKLFNHLMTHDKQKPRSSSSKMDARTENSASLSLTSAAVPEEPLDTKILPVNDIITSKTALNDNEDDSRSNDSTGVKSPQEEQEENLSEKRNEYTLMHVHTTQDKQAPTVIKSNSDQLKSLVNRALSGSTEVDAEVQTNLVDISQLGFDNEPKQDALRVNVDQTHSCGICQQSFTSLSSLKDHNISYHMARLGQMPVVITPTIPTQELLKHVCTECGKRFKTPSTLKRHALIHTSEKPHHCHICEKQFKRRDSLLKHIDEHDRVK